MGGAEARRLRLQNSWLCTRALTDSTCIRNGYILRVVKTKYASPPLTPAVLHILLALSAKARHGYEIMKQVRLDSDGKVNMGPGTLYGSLGRMLNAGLVRESERRRDPALDDERRVYYEITGAGREALTAELERYRGVVAVAKRTRLPEDA